MLSPVHCSLSWIQCTASKVAACPLRWAAVVDVKAVELAGRLSASQLRLKRWVMTSYSTSYDIVHTIIIFQYISSWLLDLSSALGYLNVPVQLGIWCPEAPRKRSAGVDSRMVRVGQAPLHFKLGWGCMVNEREVETYWDQFVWTSEWFGMSYCRAHAKRC